MQQWRVGNMIRKLLNWIIKLAMYKPKLLHLIIYITPGNFVTNLGRKWQKEKDCGIEVVKNCSSRVRCHTNISIQCAFSVIQQTWTIPSCQHSMYSFPSVLWSHNFCLINWWIRNFIIALWQGNSSRDERIGRLRRLKISLLCVTE